MNYTESHNRLVPKPLLGDGLNFLRLYIRSKQKMQSDIYPY